MWGLILKLLTRAFSPQARILLPNFLYLTKFGFNVAGTEGQGPGSDWLVRVREEHVGQVSEPDWRAEGRWACLC